MRTILPTIALLLLVLPVAARAQCSTGVPVAADCGLVPFQGCCLDFASVLFCESGVLCGLACAGNADPATQVCGFRYDYGVYDCGGGGGDPSGLFPIDCAGRLPAAPDPGGAGSCGGVDFVGCCAADSVRWCEEGAVHELDCRENSAPEERVCGWRSSHAVYDCGGAGADPTGAAPRDCLGTEPVCTPDCEGRRCGEDGCGGMCGTCAVGEYCDRGVCLPDDQCIPSCVGRECGDNGCGGMCGACGVGAVCDLASSRCVDDACAPDCGDRVCGPDGCGGACGACPTDQDCSREGRCVSAAPPPDCDVRCEGRTCGPDGCGGNCGACSAGFGCNAFGLCDPAFAEPCDPLCEGRACGPDGCGGTCGSCPPDHACNGFGLCAPDGDATGNPSADATGDVACAPEFDPLYGLCVPAAPTGSRQPADVADGGRPSGDAAASGGCSASAPAASVARDTPSAVGAVLLLLGLLAALAVVGTRDRRGRRPARRAS